MELDPVELGMKGATLAGVVLASLGIASARWSSAARLRCFVLGILGVGLMFANALIAAAPLAVLVDAAYAVLAASAFASGWREARGPRAPRAAALPTAHQALLATVPAGQAPAPAPPPLPPSPAGPVRAPRGSSRGPGG